MANPTTFFWKGDSLTAEDRNGIFSLTSSGSLKYIPSAGARTNYMKDPKPSSANNWTHTAATLTENGLTTELTPPANMSWSSYRFTRSATGEAYIENSSAYDAQVYHLLGATLTLSVYIKGTVNSRAYIQARCLQATDDQAISTHNGAETLMHGGWQRLILTFTPSLSVHRIRVRVYAATTAEVVGHEYRVMGFQLETGSEPTPLVVGGYGTAKWVNPITGIPGTADASPSITDVTAYLDEATVNLFANPSAETNLTNYAGVGGPTFTQNAEYAFMGSYCVKVATPGVAVNEGITLATPALNLTGVARPYTGQVMVKAIGTPTVNIHTRIIYSDFSVTAGASTVVTLSAAWQKITPATPVADPAKTILQINMYVRTNTIQAATFYCDAWQVENKAYATPYADGSYGIGHSWNGTAHASQTTRVGSNLSFVNNDRLTPKQGAAVIRFRRDIDTGAIAYLWGLSYSGLGEHVRAQVGTTDLVETVTRQGVGSNRTAQAAGTLPNATWTTAYSEWSAAFVKTSVNFGALAQVNRTDVITDDVFGTVNNYIGNIVGANPLNGPVAEVMMFNRPLTLAEQAILAAAPSWSFLTLDDPVETPRFLVRYKRGEGFPAPGLINVSMKYYRADHHNVWLEDISKYIGNGTVTVDLSQPSPMSLQATLLDTNVLRNFADCIAPVMTLTWVEPETEEFYTQTEQVGLYIMIPPSKTFTASGGNEEIDGRDMLWHLANKITSKPYTVGTATNLRVAITDLCNNLNLRHAIQSTTETLPKRRTWNPGTSYLTIANDLAKAAGFNPLWPDRTGRVRATRFQRLSKVEPARFLASREGVVVESVTQRPDVARICNEVTVVGNKPQKKQDAAPYRAYRVNNNPASDTSTVSLGHTDLDGDFHPLYISKFEEDSGLETQNAVDQRAERILDQGSAMFVRMNVTTLPCIDWQINDVNDVEIRTDAGEWVANGLWRWETLTLGTGVDARCEWGMAKLQPWADVT